MKGKRIGEHCYLKDMGLSPWVEVSREEYKEHFPDREIGIPGAEATWNKPVLSDGAAVHPDDAQAAMEHAAAHGVPTEFLPDGRAVFTSRKHQQAYLKLVGMVNRDENWSGKGGKREVNPRDY